MPLSRTSLFGTKASKAIQQTRYTSWRQEHYGSGTIQPIRSTSGGMQAAASDPDLVGSAGQIDDFDGTTTSFGAGGGSGSSLSGREAAGLVGDTAGKSVQDVVYGVQAKRKRGGRRARGE